MADMTSPMPELSTADGEETTIDTTAPVDPVTELSLLKTANLVAVSALETYKEPKDELKLIRDALYDAVKKDRVASDPEFAEFLYNDCAPGLTKKLHKESSCHADVSSSRPFQNSI